MYIYVDAGQLLFIFLKLDRFTHFFAILRMTFFAIHHLKWGQRWSTLAAFTYQNISQKIDVSSRLSSNNEDKNRKLGGAWAKLYNKPGGD